MKDPDEAIRLSAGEPIAVVTDIHANLPALEAVLADVRRRGIGSVFCCGDIVGYGPWPSEVVERLQDAGVTSIRGNVDVDALRFEARRKRFRKKKHPDKYRSLEYTSERLTPLARRYLSDLPERREIRVGTRRVLFVHGSPVGLSDPVLPDAPREVLESFLEREQASMIVCGHTHLPFARTLRHRVFANAGSVGRPSDGGPDPSYLVVRFGSRIQAEIVRTAYDAAPVIAEVKRRRLPHNLERIYRDGCNPWVDGTADDVESDAHLESLLVWSRALQDGLAAALADDPEGIHDVRVATRRLRARAEVGSGAHDGETSAPAGPEDSAPPEASRAGPVGAA